MKQPIAKGSVLVIILGIIVLGSVALILSHFFSGSDSSNKGELVTEKEVSCGTGTIRYEGTSKQTIETTITGEYLYYIDGSRSRELVGFSNLPFPANVRNADELTLKKLSGFSSTAKTGNVYVDPQVFSTTEFSYITDCITANETALESAMQSFAKTENEKLGYQSVVYRGLNTVIYGSRSSLERTFSCPASTQYVRAEIDGAVYFGDTRNTGNAHPFTELRLKDNTRDLYPLYSTVSDADLKALEDCTYQGKNFYELYEMNPAFIKSKIK
jgi:hypothetical protein